MIETKSSKPVPKPRVGMRKSAVRALQPPWHPRARVERGTASVFSSLGSCPGRVAHSLPLAPPHPPTLHPRFLWLERTVSFPSFLVGPNPGHGHHGAAAYSCSKHPVTSLYLSVCFALHPRCWCPPTLDVVTVTPAPLTVLPTYRCRPLVLESRSFRASRCLVCQAPQSARELSHTSASCSACVTLFSFLEIPSVCSALCFCRVSSAKLWDEPVPQAELLCPPEGSKGWGLLPTCLP